MYKTKAVKTKINKSKPSKPKFVISNTAKYKKEYDKKDYEQKPDEKLLDYKERLYKNRVLYGLEWDDISQLLNKSEHYDHVRKTSYGYLERIRDEKENNSFDNTVMIINDLHLPFERDDVLEIISKHSDEITTLVIGGDLMDCQSISFFPKVRTLTLEEELIYTYNFLKEVRKILDKKQKIIVINGNHEERFYKDICNMHEKDMQKFINPNLIDMMVEGFTIYEDNKKRRFKGIEGITYIPHWFVNIDEKLIVCHPKNFSIAKGKMLENAVSHFMNRNEEFDIVVLGHTHKQSSGIIDRYSGKFAIENGCLCKPQSYSDSGKLSFSPQSYCYTIIKYNDNEKIDYNNVRIYYLENEINHNNNINYTVNL